MEYKERPSYWDEWKYVEYLTLDQAAVMLSGIDPELANDTSTLSAKKPMLEAVRQSVIIGRLKPFRLYEWTKNGYDRWLVPVEEISSDTEIAEESTVLVADLAAWADSKGIPHHWPRVQSDEADSATSTSKLAIPYTEELQAAIDAYEAVRGNPEATQGRTPRKALLSWLEENRPNLGDNAHERIATMCNWKPQGGAPATPTGRGSE